MNIVDLYYAPSIMNGITTTILSYRIPRGKKASMWKLANGLLTTDAWGYVTWRLKLNTIPLHPYESFTSTISDPTNPQECETVNLKEYDLIECEVTNSYTTTIDIAIRILLQEKGKNENDND